VKKVCFGVRIRKKEEGGRVGRQVLTRKKEEEGEALLTGRK